MSGGYISHTSCFHSVLSLYFNLLELNVLGFYRLSSLVITKNKIHNFVLNSIHKQRGLAGLVGLSRNSASSYPTCGCA